MRIDEKLKQAALKAELDLLEAAEEREWDSTPEFARKIDLLLGRRRISKKRRILLIAAAVLLIAVFVASLPFLRKSPEQHNISQTESVDESVISGVDVPVKPEYIPEGYYMNSCTVWADGSLQIEYMNGENKIFFQSYPANEVDLSAFEEVISSVDINGNAGFAANNFNGLANNNIAWSEGGYSYIITNSQGVELEELVRIALSVNTEGEESK